MMAVAGTLLLVINVLVLVVIYPLREMHSSKPPVLFQVSAASTYRGHWCPFVRPFAALLLAMSKRGWCQNGKWKEKAAFDVSPSINLRIVTETALTPPHTTMPAFGWRKGCWRDDDLHKRFHLLHLFCLWKEAIYKLCSVSIRIWILFAFQRNPKMCALIGESVCANHFPFSFRQLDVGQEIFLVGNENVWWYQNRQEQQ